MVVPFVDEGPTRAATAEISGYRADTDDMVADLELIEADINPANGGRRTGKDPGPGGMMPPMMGGPQGAVDAGRMQAARVSQAAPGGAPVISGVTPGMAGGGSSGPGGFGVGHPVPASPGAAGAGGTVAAGSGPDQGFGINPATGRPWSPNDPGFVERFGFRDPATGVHHNPYTGMSYDPATGLWTRTGTGPVAGSGGPGAVSSGSGAPPTDGGVSWDRASGGANGSTLAAGATVTGAPPTGVPGVSSPGGGSGGVPQSGAAGSDFQVEIPELDIASAKWDDMSSGMSQIAQRIGDLTGAVQFGMVAHPLAAYHSASEAAQAQTGQVSLAYQESSAKMRQTSADYGDTEARNALAARLPEGPR